MSRVRRADKRRSGQALVEFALILPVIVLVVFALFDLGRAVFTYNTLSQSARAAARTAIVNQTNGDVEQAAIDTGASLGLVGDDIDVCFKTDTSSVTSCSGGTACASPLVVGCLAVVVVQVDYSAMTPIIGNIIGTIAMSSTSIEPIESVCPSTVRPACS
jgi:Flp pilus assembly protein TadG